ncbi:AAA family ATPase [Psychrobacillus sp. PGGUH221]|uniref:AAA family ATPase n=1 Tax=Psychrobacillus sp. PGGUH221 TaxID=3020058 RepID=UPI0035C6E7B4
MSKAIMFQGVGANAGKTVFTRSLVRLISNLGIKVSPFKPVSVGEKFETVDGLFLDFRMRILLEAARSIPTSYSAPVQIIKQKNNIGRLFVNQEEIGDVEIYAKDIALLHKLPKDNLDLIKLTIKNSYESLLAENEILVIEGAGSPLDLGIHDIPNYYTGILSNAPIILVGSVSAGGAFGSLQGTLLNFSEELKKNIIGFALNDVGFGLEIAENHAKRLEEITGIRYLGSFPHCSIYDEIPLGKSSSLISTEAEYEYLGKNFEQSINTELIYKAINITKGARV